MAKKKTTTEGATAAEAAMGEKPARGEKSQAIRDYLAQFPKAKAKGVVDGLAEKGISLRSVRDVCWLRFDHDGTAESEIRATSKKNSANAPKWESHPRLPLPSGSQPNFTP